MKKTLSFAILITPFFLMIPMLSFGQELPKLLVEIPGITEIKDFNHYIKVIYELILTISVMLAFIYIIWGGIEYINPLSSKQAAKDRMTKAITGLLIVLGTYFLLNLINPNIFKINLFSTGEPPQVVALKK